MIHEKKEYQIQILIIALLALNVLLGVYIGFFKHDALRLETLKAGGTANMKMAEQLYNSPVYIQQQKTTLDQILSSMNQAATVPITGTTATQPTQLEAQPTVDPTVAQ